MRLRLALVGATLMGGCAASTSIPDDVAGWRSFEVTVRNPSDHAFTRLPVVFALDRIRAAHPGFNPEGYRVYAGTFVELDSQCDDVNQDGVPDEMALQVNLPAGQSKTLTVYYHPSRFERPVHRRRAHAAVHTGFEGPGWESDVIAYRSYMDERAPVDIFGKSEPCLALDTYATLGHDSYHTVQPWGVDLLKVGDSLGCGGFALWEQGKLLRAVNPPVEGERPYKWTVRRYAQVVADGPVRAILRWSHDQWKVGEEKLTAAVDYEIWGGKRWSKCVFRLKDPALPKTAATGIVRKPGIEAVKGDTFLYTYGRQSEVMSDDGRPDPIGMAVLFRKEDFVAWEDGALSHSTPETEPLTHVATLAMGPDDAVAWWILAAWSRGKLGVTTAEAFASLVEEAGREAMASLDITYPER